MPRPRGARNRKISGAMPLSIYFPQSLIVRADRLRAICERNPALVGHGRISRSRVFVLAIEAGLTILEKNISRKTTQLPTP